MSILFTGKKNIKRTNTFYTLDAIAEYPELWEAVGDVLHGREFVSAVIIPECFEDCSLAIQAIEDLGLPVRWEYIKSPGAKHADIKICVGIEDGI